MLRTEYSKVNYLDSYHHIFEIIEPFFYSDFF